MADGFFIGGDSLERAEYLAGAFEQVLGPARGAGEIRAGWRNVPLQDEAFESIGASIARETPVPDVVATARAFNRHLILAETFGLPILTAEIDDIGPVPVLNPILDHSRSLSEITRDIDHWIAGYRGVQGVNLDQPFVNPRETLRAFTRGLKLFLGFRFEGFRVIWNSQPARSSPVSPPPPGSAAPGETGFNVQLFCRQSKLAAYASPTYALTWRGLGSFTVPAHGVLPPGAWIFGASGTPLPMFVYDPAPVFVPPTFTPTTTCF